MNLRIIFHKILYLSKVAVYPDHLSKQINVRDSLSDLLKQNKHKNSKSMKKNLLPLVFILSASLFTFGQSGNNGGPDGNTRIFTMFTSSGCGCTGSGGAPWTFTTHEMVLEDLRQACNDIDFIRWEGTYGDAVREVENNKEEYDGVLIVGRLNWDYRLAFTGLPTIVVYNLFEFIDAQPYHLFDTGETDQQRNVLKGGTDYKEHRILTATLDRRNVSDPLVTDAMFEDLVYKIRLIRAIKELQQTRILMVKNDSSEVIASVNYRGDFNQWFPPDHNARFTRKLNQLCGAEIIPVEAEEFYRAYEHTDIKRAEEVAEEWMNGAREVEASKREIIKTARGYLALEALREKYDCNAVSTHIRTVTGSGKLEDRYNPGLGLELGFKTRGIQAVCQNYPDLLIAQVMGYLLTGRPSMLGDYMYDVFNSTEILLHCGIPVNPYGDERMIPYTIRTHAESPVRDIPQEPGSSTGITAEWPAGETVTLWEVHPFTREIRLHTGTVVDGKAVYSGGEDLDNVMCTAKIIARVDDIEKIQDQFQPYLYGIHRIATLGDLRQPIKDIARLLGLEVIEMDR